ncbi:MAG: DUF896 domain-containing protein [Eubacteriales bacterium]|nr:DUF896 domain-containing protein [Eubacteriales bacterium]
MTKAEIDRINELYHKSQSETGLTPAEAEERDMLRRKYIASVRANLRGQLDNVDIKNEDGSITPLKKK